MAMLSDIVCIITSYVHKKLNNSYSVVCCVVTLFKLKFDAGMHIISGILVANTFCHSYLLINPMRKDKIIMER